MKGLFLSRKLKLPPALFKVEELALEFAKLSSKHLEIDYDALDRAAENSAQLDNLTGRKAYTEKKKYKSRRIRASVDAALTNPQYETKLMYVNCWVVLIQSWSFNTKGRLHSSRDEVHLSIAYS